MVVRGHGVEINSDQFNTKNWKDDANYQHFSAFLNTHYTRGIIELSNMDISSPPSGVCSQNVQLEVTQNMKYE